MLTSVLNVILFAVQGFLFWLFEVSFVILAWIRF